MTIARGVVVAWFCFHVEIVRAAVLFSTFGTGTGYDSTNGLTLDGPLSPFPQAIAEQTCATDYPAI